MNVSAPRGADSGQLNADGNVASRFLRDKHPCRVSVGREEGEEGRYLRNRGITGRVER